MRLVNILTGLLLLTGCALHHPVIIEKDTFTLSSGHRAQHPAPPENYQVVLGDTLYSIAFRFSTSVDHLVALNRISAPYVIIPGQTLKIKGEIPDVAAVRASQSGVSLAPLAPVVPALIVNNNAAAPDSTKPSQNAAKPVAALSKISPKKPSARPVNQAKPIAVAPKIKPVKPVKTAGNHWQWPSGGRVISRFGSNGGLNKGVDLAGHFKESIVAARDGAVVYAGSGLRGYGKLVILKHDEVFLTAYAHCETLLVAEGDRVRRGQKIALMGSSGTDQVMLHFEVRKSGTPVDPLHFLPKR